MNVFQNQHEVQQSGHIKSFPNGKVSEKTKILVQRPEHCSFPVDLHKIQTLETSIVDMSVESLNFWLTKFFEEIVKKNGER